MRKENNSINISIYALIEFVKSFATITKYLTAWGGVSYTVYISFIKFLLHIYYLIN